MYRYYYKDKAINGKDCDEFIDTYKDVEFSLGLAGKDIKNSNEQHRKAKIYWLDFNNITEKGLDEKNRLCTLAGLNIKYASEKNWKKRTDQNNPICP